MKERKLYSLTGKLIVFLLLIVFAASALFGGIQTLMLSSVGLTPNAAAKKYAFEETTACGTLEMCIRDSSVTGFKRYRNACTSYPSKTYSL